MVKIRDTGQFAMGLFFVFPTVYLTILGIPIDLVFIIFLLGGIYLIISSILEREQAILSILLGIAILISVFAWLITQKAALLSKDVVGGIIMALFFFILGIITHLGFLPEK